MLGSVALPDIRADLNLRLAVAGLSAAAHILIDLALQIGPIGAAGRSFVKRHNPDVSAQKAGVLWTGMVTRLVSSAHHLSLLPICFMTVLDRQYWDAPFTHAGFASSYVLAIATGHFIFDTYVSLRDMAADGWVFVLHGVISTALFGLAIWANAWNFFAVVFFFFECSTPFVHIRYWLSALGKKGSKWFMINAFALMAVFFACRVAWGTAMSAFFWWCTRQALLGRMDPGVPLWAVWPTRAANLIMMTLNYNWFSRMVMVAYKVYKGKGLKDVEPEPAGADGKKGKSNGKAKGA